MPPSIGQLKSVEYLFLVGNKINSLPPELNQMKHLRYLDLTDNPLPPLLNDDYHRQLDPKVVIRLRKKE
ncbi:MAG: leucine-rich repeat domain-containing protein [Cyclobacteriaceae bacterium]